MGERHGDPLATMASWFAPEGQQRTVHPSQSRPVGVSSMTIQRERSLLVGVGMMFQVRFPFPCTVGNLSMGWWEQRRVDTLIKALFARIVQVHTDRSLRVAQIESNCSAARSGVIQFDDEVLKIDGRNVEKQPISILKDMVPGWQ